MNNCYNPIHYLVNTVMLMLKVIIRNVISNIYINVTNKFIINYLFKNITCNITYVTLLLHRNCTPHKIGSYKILIYRIGN